MDRRSFIKGCVATWSAMAAGNWYGVFDGLAYGDNEVPDIVAVMGGTPGRLFDRAITAMGGMKSFVKPNQTVVIKPNIAWDVAPQIGANTNPELVKRVVEHCFDAGAKSVFVFDHTCDVWTRSYKTSGIESLVKKAGGTVVPGNRKGSYQKVEIKKGKNLRAAMVHELILESDVFINMPVLKHHSSAGVTIGMKNLMGAVWDRWYWHRNDLHQCIADFSSFRKPDLSIIDAYRVLMRNGPRGVSEADSVLRKFLILSRDIVAGDAAASKLFGREPESVGYIKYAGDMGIGRYDLSNLNIMRLKI